MEVANIRAGCGFGSAPLESCLNAGWNMICLPVRRGLSACWWLPKPYRLVFQKSFIVDVKEEWENPLAALTRGSVCHMEPDWLSSVAQVSVVLFS